MRGNNLLFILFAIMCFVWGHWVFGIVFLILGLAD